MLRRLTRRARSLRLRFGFLMTWWRTAVTRALSNTVLGCFLAASWLLASCSQDAGDSCQLASDCSSGLTCCKGKSAERGYCGYAKDDACFGGDVVDSGISDASTGTDAASFDDSGSMSSEDASSDGG